MSKWPIKRLKLIITVIVLSVYGLSFWAWVEIQAPNLAVICTGCIC